MTKYQKNKYSMFIGVRSYLDDHSSGYENNEEFNEHIRSFKSVLSVIAGKETERSNATAGTVKYKVILRRKVTDLALAVAGALYSHAKKTGNVPLMERMKLRKTDLKAFREAMLVIELNSIKENAVQIKAEISRYGITDEVLTEFDDCITEYTEAIGLSAAGNAIKSGTTLTMVTLFKEADSVLDSIDRLMGLYKIKYADFYEGYRSSRVIKDLGIRHTGNKALENPDTGKNDGIEIQETSGLMSYLKAE